MTGKFRLSVGSLILVNLLPLAGVLFMDWNAAAVVLLYWSENVVVGLFNILKMIKAKGTSSKAKYYIDGKRVESARKAFIIPFFAAHFGIFTLAHGLFVFSLFADDLPPGASIGWAGVCLLLSHGVSYVTHFLRNGEYLRVAAQDLFFQPYRRVVVMHLTILFGAWAAVALGEPVFILIVMIGLKIIVDIWAHRKEHRSFAVKT